MRILVNLMLTILLTVAAPLIYAGELVRLVVSATFNVELLRDFVNGYRDIWRTN